MIREDLYRIMQESGLNLAASRSIVDGFFREIRNGILTGKTVKIKNLVSFRTRIKKEINIMNNKNKKRMAIPSHKVVLAKFSRQMKHILNSGDNPL